MEAMVLISLCSPNEWANWDDISLTLLLLLNFKQELFSSKVLSAGLCMVSFCQNVFTVEALAFYIYMFILEHLYSRLFSIQAQYSILCNAFF